ncbi:MAG: OmpA family protein [Saprospiraceae bacterium]|nr:OmpA family protein [Saprospiraceae bacterium]
MLKYLGILFSCLSFVLSSYAQIDSLQPVDASTVPTVLYVQDAYSARILVGAELRIIHKKDIAQETVLDKEIGVFKTNEQGNFVIDLQVDSEFFIQTEKNGYYTQIAKISTVGFSRTKRNRFGISLRPQDCFKIVGYVRNLYSNMPLVEQPIKIQTSGDPNPLDLLTDTDGKYVICGECGKSYTINLVSEDYYEMSAELELSRKICNESEKRLLIINFTPKPIPKPGQETDYAINNTSTFNRPTPANNTMSDEDPLNKALYKRNDLIILQNLNFKGKTAILTKEGRETLDKLHVLFSEHTGIKVEISVHTDSRKSNRLNWLVSKKRSKVIDQFLRERGVRSSQYQIEPKGEEELMNRCKDGVRCSDIEHQENSRVELLVLRGNANS